MQVKLNLNLLLLLGICACSWAYPSSLQMTQELLETPNILELEEPSYWSPFELEQALAEPEELEQQVRLRRQLNVQGGGSPRQGFDLSVNGRAPVWQSHNGRHSLDATGQYSQHLGGPYGNSRPNWGAGAVYTFRF